MMVPQRWMPLALVVVLTQPVACLVVVRPVNSYRAACSRPSSFRLFLSSSDYARTLLFQDQQGAMGRRAELEEQLMKPNTSEMTTTRKKKKNRSGGGGGFGANAATKGKSAAQRKLDDKYEIIKGDGVLLVEKAFKRKTALKLRETVMKEMEIMKETVDEDPSKSVALFNVPVETHNPLRGYVLLPFRASETSEESKSDVIVKSLQELLGEGSTLGGLFERACDGKDAEMHDFFALRTEPGSVRQEMHYDTPYQEIPALYCAFIALQDITFEMGPTVFIKGTHVETPERIEFEDGVQDGRRDAMLKEAKSYYALLKAGDAAFFDMRTLHAGMANLVEGGSTRYLLVLTFRNLAAKGELGHKANMRPDYLHKYTLEDIQTELKKDTPFATAGDGVPK